MPNCQFIFIAFKDYFPHNLQIKRKDYDKNVCEVMELIMNEIYGTPPLTSDDGANKTEEEKLAMERIKESSAAEIKTDKGNIYCLTIIGQIEGHMLLPPQNKTTKYEHIIPQLVSVEESNEIDALLIILNTMGGDVEAGLAISEMVSGMKKPTVSLVLGGGHSIGVPLAVASDYSIIAPTATMTLHPIRFNGTVIGVPQTFEYLERMQERVVQFVIKNSNITRDDFRRLMLNTGELANDVGTVLLGQDAVDYGLIDQVGGVSDAIEKLYSMIRGV